MIFLSTLLNAIIVDTDTVVSFYCRRYLGVSTLTRRPWLWPSLFIKSAVIGNWRYIWSIWLQATHCGVVPLSLIPSSVTSGILRDFFTVFVQWTQGMLHQQIGLLRLALQLFLLNSRGSTRFLVSKNHTPYRCRMHFVIWQKVRIS